MIDLTMQNCTLWQLYTGLMTFDHREELRVAVTKGDSDTVQKIIDSNLGDVDTVLSEVGGSVLSYVHGYVPCPSRA